MKNPSYILVFNLYLFCVDILPSQIRNIEEYSPLKKRVYSFTKLDFITSEGEF
mgnify:CR=1